MKKVISIILLFTLILTAMTFPVAADVDATSTATVGTSGATAKSEPAPTTTAPTPALTSSQTPVADKPAVPAGEAYTVVSGDAFWKIAQKYNLTVDQLVKLNPQIKNINLIHVGDKIIVKAATPATPVAPSVPSVPVATASKLYHGFGEVANYRVRGASATLNIATASVLFDENGKIVDLTWDVMEINAAKFPGWHDETTEQAVLDEKVASINTWKTKRELGFDYDMTHLKSKGAADNASKKEWFEQLDYYEDFFKGMTVAEVQAWVEKYTDANTKPYKMAYPDLLTEENKAVTSTFTAEEQAMLIDVTTSATMALEDGHSHLLSALVEAYEAREEVK